MKTDKHPSFSECMELLEKYNTPAHVKRHCIAVTDVSMAFARALNEKGFDFNIPLIRSAGLLHDIARVEDEHWNKGADLAFERGFQKEAEIIRAHMFYSFKSELNELSEVDMVCLGDRLVKEDEYVGLDERMAYILKKAEYNNINAQQIIQEKIELTRDILKKIEDFVGFPTNEIVKVFGNNLQIHY